MFFDPPADNQRHGQIGSYLLRSGRREPAAGQLVHEPVSEVLADHRTGEGFPGTGGQLRG